MKKIIITIFTIITATIFIFPSIELQAASEMPNLPGINVLENTSDDRGYITIMTDDTYAYFANYGAGIELTQQGMEEWPNGKFKADIDNTFFKSIEILINGVSVIKYGLTQLTQIRIEKKEVSGIDFSIYIGTNPQHNVSLGNSAIFKLTHKGKPVFDGQELNITTNVNSPRSIANIMENLKAYDDEDGDITNKIIIEPTTNYEAKKIIGNYKIDLSVSDSSNNKTEITINVNVQDTDLPQIEPVGTNDITSNLSSPITINNLKTNILDYFNINDNYDSFDNLTITINDANDFENNNTTIGIYNLVLVVKDSSNNTTNHNFTITVYDNIPPIFSGETAFQVSNSTIVSKSFILSQIYANDNIDGVILPFLVSSSYWQNGGKKGTYTETVRAIDNNGNVSDQTITIIAIDDTKPIFYVNGTLFILKGLQQPFTNDIVAYLKKTGQIPNKSIINITKDTYANNENEAGEYQIVLLDENGGEYDFKVIVLSESETSEAIGEKEEKPLSNWQKFANSISKFFNNNKTIIIFSLVAIIVVGLSIGIIIWKRRQ